MRVINVCLTELFAYVKRAAAQSARRVVPMTAPGKVERRILRSDGREAELEQTGIGALRLDAVANAHWPVLLAIDSSFRSCAMNRSLPDQLGWLGGRRAGRSALGVADAIQENLVG
jgi:hypothetical protein